MKVTLIEYTSAQALVKATAMPYQTQESLDVVSRVWDSGHRSIARHGMASFLVKGVSQSLLRQLSRHPHLNLTVKSSRYCNMNNVGCIIPPFIKTADVTEYCTDYTTIMKIYNKWNEKEGYKKNENREASKMMLPLGSTTDLVVSGNYQALYEFLQLRLCVRAEWEIQKMAKEMVELLKQIMPEIFAGLGCIGDEWGVCPESHGACGKWPLKRSRFPRQIISV